MRSHGHAHHVHVPVFHLHTPHLEWQEVHHPIRAALVTITLVATVALTGLLFESAQQAVARASTPMLPVPEYEPRPLDREWLYSTPTVDTSDIVRKGAETRSLDHMWRKR